MKNAGKACNNRLYRHIRTFEKIVKNYFVIYLKSVYLDSMIDRTGQINKYLVENGVTVNQISIHAINLEEYFLRKVGA